MKVLLVSMVFSIIISGLLALQIKTAYTYQTAQLIVQASKQEMILESALNHAVCSFKKNQKNHSYELDFSHYVPHTSVDIMIQILDAKAYIKAYLCSDNKRIKSASCTLEISDTCTIIDWKS